MIIAGIGTATPEHVIEQIDAAEMGAQLCCRTDRHQRMLPVLYRRTGVKTRHCVVLHSSTNGDRAQQSFYNPATSPDDHGPTTSKRMQFYESDAAPLALRAARKALAGAGVDSADLTHLITISCSGFSAPGVDISLIGKLGLAADTARAHIGFMGCHGALNGLRVAKAFADADPDACILLCAVELCSLHQQYGWNPGRIVANALFGDGAAAVVGYSGSSDSQPSWRVTATGSTIIPNSENMMSWRIGNHGFEMTLSARVPDLIRRHLRGWLQSWLADNGLSIDEIGSWAVHPGGPRILQACAEAAGFDPAHLCASREILGEFGNMSSPTVLFILERLQRRSAALPCVLLGFGPGLAVEAVLIR